jgi:hypothetical protein
MKVHARCSAGHLASAGDCDSILANAVTTRSQGVPRLTSRAFLLKDRGKLFPKYCHLSCPFGLNDRAREI